MVSNELKLKRISDFLINYVSNGQELDERGAKKHAFGFIIFKFLHLLEINKKF